MNNLKKTDNIHIFCGSNISFFFFMKATPMLRPFSARPIFDWNFLRPYYVPCNASFSYVQNKKRNKIWVLPCLRHLLFYFRVAASNYDKSFLKHSYRKKTRWWCAHDEPIVFFLFWLIIMVSLLIPRFLLPALRYILFVSGSLWFAARWSMIDYFSRSSLFLILCSLLTSLSYWGEGGGKC